MTPRETIQLAIAVAMIGGAIFLYVKRERGAPLRDSQGAVFLLLVGVIVAMHALGAFEYRPSQSEIEAGRVMPLIAR